ncbi:MAG: ATP-binding protein [Candidatus Thiodiazotropha endolucinida]|nr:ATP-binding protein [Candidatus Thiodiazotropha taylori]MCG8025043.1 ATP-binding protein [Candidatus Thiodiazotropha endolucinida]MCG7883851.1 ATP-binding protein [Candidatus Thiodiazotropha taylori]MCG7885179.1 ATP-binding protein [Candidatus Thiodiazotropha taylori]MCG7890267.1 ATP-binding protein [Candidatus Thiodiazotropha taylori]
MPQKMNLPFTQTLRFKLLLVSFSLILIPWAGYHYLSEMEASLRQAQEALLLNRAEIVANMLAANSNNWLAGTTSENVTHNNSLYVHPLANSPDLDGYDEDWLSLKSQSRQFRASATTPDAVSFEWLAGFQGENIYLMIEVRDQTLIYPQSERILSVGDHLILALPGPSGKSRKYRLGTPAPGWVNVVEYENNRQQTAIRGEWQETAHGYRVELQIPRSMTDGHLSLAVVDIDIPQAKPVGIASTSGWNSNQNLSRLVMPTIQVDRLLSGLEEKNHRYTILNRKRQVIGRYGSIQTSIKPNHILLSRLISLLSPSAEETGIDAREGMGKLDGPEIRRSLSGEGAIYRYSITGSKSMILSAAHPIEIGQNTIGTVVVEQSTQMILLLQQSALERLFLISLILFIITGGTLLLFASSLTRRITRLSHKYNRAVSPDGRIIEEVQSGKDKDELGELDRSFSAVLRRSVAYTGYLESMAARLTHEIRTPLTMVQGSLENLQHDSDSFQKSPYIERALDGTRRLNLILTRIREATRLEQSLQNSEKEKVNITAFCKSLCDGYAITYQHIDFECRIPAYPIWIQISPDLLSQAVDKLISNAIDFHQPNTAIQIILDDMNNKALDIKIRNRGPQLAESDIPKLFHNMESKRKGNDNQIHLGIGLYLVRLIAEFHQGDAWMNNETDGVCFAITLPYTI